MSKKQKLISTTEVSSLIRMDTQYHFILKDNSVIFGSIQKIGDELIKIKNTKGHNINLSMDQISEIWTDEKAV